MPTFTRRRDEGPNAIPLCGCAAQVPELANSEAWDGDQVIPPTEQQHPGNTWHRVTRKWTPSEDQLLLDAVVRFKPDAAAYEDGKKSARAIRYDMNPKLRVALRPVADQLSKTPEACWKRYKRLAEASASNHGAVGGLAPWNDTGGSKRCLCGHLDALRCVC